MSYCKQSIGEISCAFFIYLLHHTYYIPVYINKDKTEKNNNFMHYNDLSLFIYVYFTMQVTFYISKERNYIIFVDLIEHERKENVFMIFNQYMFLSDSRNASNSISCVWMCFGNGSNPARGVSKRQTHRWQARDWLPLRSGKHTRLNGSGRLGCQSASVFTLPPAGRLKNCHAAPSQEPGAWAKISDRECVHPRCSSVSLTLSQSYWTHFLTHTLVIWSSSTTAKLPISCAAIRVKIFNLHSLQLIFIAEFDWMFCYRNVWNVAQGISESVLI